MNNVWKKQIDELFRRRKIIRNQFYEALITSNLELEMHLGNELHKIREMIVARYRLSKRFST